MRYLTFIIFVIITNSSNAQVSRLIFDDDTIHVEEYTSHEFNTSFDSLIIDQIPPIIKLGRVSQISDLITYKYEIHYSDTLKSVAYHKQYEKVDYLPRPRLIMTDNFKIERYSLLRIRNGVSYPIDYYHLNDAFDEGKFEIDIVDGDVYYIQNILIKNTTNDENCILECYLKCNVKVKEN